MFCSEAYILGSRAADRDEDMQRILSQYNQVHKTTKLFQPSQEHTISQPFAPRHRNRPSMSSKDQGVAKEYDEPKKSK